MGNKSSRSAHYRALVAASGPTGEPPGRKTVVLKVYLHCVSCSYRIRRKLYDVPGVENVSIDMENNLLSVTGAVDTVALVLYLYKRFRKRAQLVGERDPDDGAANGGSMTVEGMNPVPYQGFDGGGFYYRGPTPPGFYGGGPVGGWGYPPYPPPYPPYGANPYYGYYDNPQGCTIM